MTMRIKAARYEGTTALRTGLVVGQGERTDRLFNSFEGASVDYVEHSQEYSHVDFRKEPKSYNKKKLGLRGRRKHMSETSKKLNFRILQVFAKARATHEEAVRVVARAEEAIERYDSTNLRSRQAIERVKHRLS